MITHARRLCCIPALLAIVASAVTAQNPRITVFISDTHFGVGKTPDGPMITHARRLCCIPALLAIVASAVTAQNPRITVFISDTHFGVGKTPDGKWHPYED